jgi:prepilin-type N-terminal cleavage/methylation domain-containing protein
MISKLFKIASVRARGFTLIETLVAVLLLALAIVGPLSIASKGLTATLVAKDQFTAFYLAQDAVEHIRFLRDSACLAATPDSTGCPAANWLGSLSACVSTTGSTKCQLDSLSTNPASPATCASGVCDTMRYDSALRVFNYNTSAALSPQRFVRTISVQNNPSGTTPDEAVVTVTVSWTDTAGVTRVPITVKETIFRWQ